MIEKNVIDHIMIQNINIYHDIINKFNVSDIIYIFWIDEEYKLFKEKTGLELQSYKYNNIYELITIINSCKLHISNFSTPLAISFALKHDSIGISHNFIYEEVFFQNLPYTTTKIIQNSSDIDKN